MTRLNNIPKKTPFTVPDGYFEKLPAKIQSRISATAQDGDPGVWHRYGFRLAVPLAAVAGVLVFYLFSMKTDAEAILASVGTADLILYVQETSLTISTEEFLDDWDISTAEVEAVENEVYNLHLEQTGDEALELELNNL